MYSSALVLLAATPLGNDTFVERTDSSGEDIVSGPGSQSNTTVNAPTLDNGCRDGIVTHPCLNTPSGPDSPQENHIVITVINRVQLVITCAGFLAKGATYLTLSCNGARFSMLILLVIKHQSLVDMGICGMGALYLLLPVRELGDRKSYCRCNRLLHMAQSGHVLGKRIRQYRESRAARRGTLHHDM